MKLSIELMLQTNICNGPIYFNCAPNYSVDLTDPLISDSLILDIHLQGDEFKELCKNFAIIYRIYFRVMTSQMNPKFILTPTSKEEIVLLQVEAENPTFFIPK